LTLLTTLKDEQIERLVNSGEIDSHTTRAELKKLIGRERNVVEYERSMLMIINESMSTVKNQDIERINEMLKELGWKVKLKK
jgi:transposase